MSGGSSRCLLTHTVPDAIRWATSKARFESLPHTVPPKPYSVLLARAVRNVAHNGRRNEVSVALHSLAARDDLAHQARVFQKFFHFLESRLVLQGPHLGRGVESVADHMGIGQFGQFLAHRVKSRPIAGLITSRVAAPVTNCPLINIRKSGVEPGYVLGFALIKDTFVNIALNARSFHSTRAKQPFLEPANTSRSTR